MDSDMLKGLELGYSSYRYFPSELHPTISKVGRKQFTHPTCYEHHDELEYILVRAGTGQLFVNHRIFQLEPGAAGMFMSFDFHRFEPTVGETLDVDYLRISSGTFLYMMACPYSVLPDLDISNYMFTFHRLVGEDLTSIGRLFDELRKLMASSGGENKKAIYFLMELVGKYRRNANIR